MTETQFSLQDLLITAMPMILQPYVFLKNIFPLVRLGLLNTSAPQNVNIHTLRALCTHLYEKRPLLVCLPPRTAQNLQSIPFVLLGSLRPDTLVHALLQVKHTRMISGDSFTLHTKTYNDYFNTLILLYLPGFFLYLCFIFCI